MPADSSAFDPYKTPAMPAYSTGPVAKSGRPGVLTALCVGCIVIGALGIFNGLLRTVGTVFGHEDPHGLGDRLRVDAVQLDGARRLGLVVRDKAHRRGVPLDEGTRCDHLADVEAGAVLAAQTAEGGVGDAGHGSEHDGRIELDGPDAQSAGRSEGGRHPSILPDETEPSPVEDGIAWWT